MTDTMPEPGFSRDEVFTQAQGNVTGFGLALLRYARDHGAALEAAARWLGELFASGWEDLRGKGAHRVARMPALNLVSGGAVLHGLTGGTERAEITVGSWPGEELLAFFELDRSEADAVFVVFAPIAEYVGLLRYRWQREGDTVTLTFEREAG